MSKYGVISIQYLTYAIYECFSSSDKKQSICKKRIRELTEDDIYTFIQTILMDKDLSTKEYGNVKTVLQGMIRYARFEKKYTSINISNFFGDFRVGKNILKKSEKTDAQKCFTDEERIRILKLVDKKPDIRNLAIHLCFQTGVRVGELAALKWEDISLENKVIFVRHTMQRLKNLNPASEERTRIITGVPKSGRSVRTIPMNQDIEKLCNKWRADDVEAYVLTGKAGHFLEPRTLQYRMRQYTKDCDLKNVHFHTLRHSFATRCVEAGFEIRSLSEILGHSSTRITLECYVHSSMNLKRKNMEKLKIADTVEKEFPGA